MTKKKNTYVKNKNRYIRNSPTVKKLGKIYNFKTHSCQPGWRVMRINDYSTSDIPDWLMGLMAKENGLKWEFEISRKKLEENIKQYDGHILVLKESNKHYKETELKLPDHKTWKRMIKSVDDDIKKSKKHIHELELELKERMCFVIKRKSK